MLWQTVFNRLGKQPASFTSKHHAWLRTSDPKTGQELRIGLDLRFTGNGKPYFVENPNIKITVKDL